MFCYFDEYVFIPVWDRYAPDDTMLADPMYKRIQDSATDMPANKFNYV